MLVLYKGEHKDIDVSADSQFKHIMNGLTMRKANLGTQVGDFEVIVVDYDWGYRKRVNIVKCVHCGEEMEVMDIRQWRKGRGERRRCQCRKMKSVKPPKLEKPQGSKYLQYVGETINGFRLLKYKVGHGFYAECVKCGKQKWIQGKTVLDGKAECNHHITAVYDDSLVGQKFGHLTAIEHIGKYFKFRCDCGCEKTLRPTDVCRGAITTCGRSECEYHNQNNFNPETKKAIEEGFAFEQHFADVFEKAGYKVIKTQDSGDFGVDVIVWIKGEKWAFQCKKSKKPSHNLAEMQVRKGIGSESK